MPNLGNLSTFIILTNSGNLSSYGKKYYIDIIICPYLENFDIDINLQYDPLGQLVYYIICQLGQLVYLYICRTLTTCLHSYQSNLGNLSALLYSMPILPKFISQITGNCHAQGCLFTLMIYVCYFFFSD